MDERVIGITIAVLALAATVRGIPQRLWGMIRGGGGQKLGDTLALLTRDATAYSPSDRVARNPGLAGTQPDGWIPAYAANIAGNIGGTIANLLNYHAAAWQNNALDPALQKIFSDFPATNDPRASEWVAALQNCYLGGSDAPSCAGQATRNVGWSPFG